MDSIDADLLGRSSDQLEIYDLSDISIADCNKIRIVQDIKSEEEVVTESVAGEREADSNSLPGLLEHCDMCCGRRLAMHCSFWNSVKESNDEESVAISDHGESVAENSNTDSLDT